MGAQDFNNRSQFSRLRDSTYEILSKRTSLIIITVLPAFLLFLFINLLPIGWAIAASVHSVHAFSPEWSLVGLSNYIDIIQDSDFWASVYRSVVFATGSVIIQVSTGTIIALLVNRTFTGNKIVRAIVMLPFLVPTAILGFIALWMGNSTYGIINQIIVRFGLSGDYISWFGTELAMFSTILVASWKYAIFVTIMVLARLQSIPSEYYDAAKMSGATAYQRFRDVTLPNLKGVLFIVILLRGVWMFNTFDIIYVLTRGGPLNQTTVAPIYAYNIAFNQYNLGEAAAVSTMLFILVATAALIYFKVFSPEEEVRVE